MKLRETRLPSGLTGYLVADCSTAHIRKSDADLLEASEEAASSTELYSFHKQRCSLSFTSREFGWLVSIPDETYIRWKELCRADGFSEEFIRLINDVRNDGCWFLMLDCDGEQYGHLPVFDW